MASSGSSPRPLIGLSSYVERCRFGVWDTEAVVLHRSYVDSVLRAGGSPVLLPSIGEPDPRLLATLDGLIVCGGADLDPAGYGQPVHPNTGTLRPERDHYERGLLHSAPPEQPVLGVCRGMQLLNVELGGTLAQDLPAVLDLPAHVIAPGQFERTEVVLSRDSRIAGLLGERTEVSCHHHQALGDLGRGLRVTGRAADGTAEAVELDGPRFVLGVQWHPEADASDDRIFAGLVAAAERYRAEREERE